MRKWVKFGFLAIGLCIGISVACVYNYKQGAKIGVVDMVLLFKSYNMKIELEAAAEAKFHRLQHVLDSLDTDLKLATATGDKTKAAKLSEQVGNLNEEALTAKEQVDEDIRNQVWKRLNPLFQRYGKEKNMRVVLGADASGNVLYVDGDNDITDDFIKYVNNQYESGN